MSGRQGGRLDFPGVFTATVVGVVLAVVWPWVLLHGTAMVIAGVAWSLLLAAVAVLWVAGSMHVRGKL